MILLQSGINSKIDLTLTEKSLLTDPEYVIVFVNDSNASKVACKISDISSFPSRYNRFVIDVKASGAVAMSGEVNLTLEGFYHYYCYEIADASTFNYATINTTTIESLGDTVEVGKMLYAFDYQSYTNYINNKPSIAVYNG